MTRRRRRGRRPHRSQWASSADKVRFFFDLFRCRTDVYALRWENRRDGRSGWMPAIKGYWRKGMNRADAPYLPLTPEVVDAHLRGEAHIGLYPLSDDDNCWWVAADFDKEAAMLDALAYMKAARSYGIPAALEVSPSGRGAHVWIFFAHAISASVARSIATSLLGEAFRLRGSMHLSSYDRLFPSQDVHTRARGHESMTAKSLEEHAQNWDLRHEDFKDNDFLYDVYSVFTSRADGSPRR
jgi:hypothetical protein